MLDVAAVITAKPGQRESILRHFRANVPAVRAEKGCIEYAAAVDADPALPMQTKYGPDTFSRHREGEEQGGAEGARRRATHGGLRGESEGPDREPHDPHPAAGLTT